MANHYNKYVLIAKTKFGIIEINWTSIKDFAPLTKQKYKLEKIDYFTTHFIDENELIEFLIKNNLLPTIGLKKTRLSICPIQINEDKSEIVGESPLAYGIARRKHLELFNSDNA